MVWLGGDSMATLKKRLIALVVLALLSLCSIVLLLPSSKVTELTLGTSIDKFGDMWKWGSEEVEDDLVEETGGGIRLVVFGDSWVDDTTEQGGSGKGKSWTEVLCEEINCTSRLNFAASQPGDAFPALEATGVATSNRVHALAIAVDNLIPVKDNGVTPLPDLAAQIQSFIALPVPKVQPKQTLFVLSFGFWDIYDFARVQYPFGQNATDTSIDELFEQLDVLYLHFAEKLYPNQTQQDVNATEVPEKGHQFRIIIPRLFDITLLPGWLSNRPMPIAPSSIAEQQKTAVYLTDRWNQRLENKMGSWINSPPPQPSVPENAAPPPPPPPSSPVAAEPVNPKPHSDFHEPESNHKLVRDPLLIEHDPPPNPFTILKDVFYFDTPRFLLDIIVEHSLEDEGISDAAGLGKGESPFESVYLPCMREAEEGEDTSAFTDINGLLVCEEPRDYLFWDAWSLGPVPKESIGKQIADMLVEGNSLRSAWEKKAGARAQAS